MRGWLVLALSAVMQTVETAMPVVNLDSFLFLFYFLFKLFYKVRYQWRHQHDLSISWRKEKGMAYFILPHY